MIYYGIEPFGVEMALLGSAITSSVVANVNRNPKKNPTPYKPKDFMPTFKKKKPQTTEEMLGVAKLWTMVSGGEDNRE